MYTYIYICIHNYICIIHIDTRASVWLCHMFAAEGIWMRWLIQSQICFWPVTGSSLLRNTPQILQNRLATYVLIAVKGLYQEQTTRGAFRVWRV